MTLANLKIRLLKTDDLEITKMLEERIARKLKHPKYADLKPVVQVTTQRKVEVKKDAKK